MATIVRASLYLGNLDEDSAERPFIWGDVLSTSPKDMEGKAVKSPASFLVYNAGEFAKSGKVLKGAFKQTPGTPLLEYIHDTDDLLEALDLADISELPEITCLERRQSGEALSPESIRARESRMSRRQARSMNVSAGTPETVQY